MGQTLELKTTTNQAEERIIIQFIFPTDGDHYYLVFKCTSVHSSTWIYVLRHCMTDKWYAAQNFTGVPSDTLKVWQITRTHTSLLVVCNGVTVLDFNFATDYRNGYSKCHSLWTRHSTTIQFSNHAGSLYGNNGHLFMRTVTHGKFLSSRI